MDYREGDIDRPTDRRLFDVTCGRWMMCLLMMYDDESPAGLTALWMHYVGWARDWVQPRASGDRVMQWDQLFNS